MILVKIPALKPNIKNAIIHTIETGSKYAKPHATRGINSVEKYHNAIDNAPNIAAPAISIVRFFRLLSGTIRGFSETLTVEDSIILTQF